LDASPTGVLFLYVIPAGIAGQIGRIADLHGSAARMHPVAMEGKLDSPPCVLDTGIPAGMTMPLPLAEKFP